MLDGTDVLGCDHLKAGLGGLFLEDRAADLEVAAGQIEAWVTGRVVDLLFGEQLQQSRAEHLGRHAVVAQGILVDGSHHPQHVLDLLLALDVGVMSTSGVVEQGLGLFHGEHLVTVIERVGDDVGVPDHGLHQPSHGIVGIVLGQELVAHDVDATRSQVVADVGEVLLHRFTLGDVVVHALRQEHVREFGMAVGLSVVLVEGVPREPFLCVVDEGGVVVHARVRDAADGHQPLGQSGRSAAHLHHHPVALVHLGLHHVPQDGVAGLDVEMMVSHLPVEGLGVDDGRVGRTFAHGFLPIWVVCHTRLSSMTAKYILI